MVTSGTMTNRLDRLGGRGLLEREHDTDRHHRQRQRPYELHPAEPLLALGFHRFGSEEQAHRASEEKNADRLGRSASITELEG